MNQSEQIKKKIMELVITAKNQRLRRDTMLMVLCDRLGIPESRVMEALEDLIIEKKLIFTYRESCAFVETPFEQWPRGVRPLKVVTNGSGNPWICDYDVDSSKDLAEQGCWQFGEEDSGRSD